MSLMLALSAAGFIATSTFGESPGVRMSWSEMWTWNDDTPAMVPAGARIPAGKFGRVARSLPKAALTSVNRSPASCMPSPESPANRMTTRSSVSGRRVEVVSAVTFLPLPPRRRGGVGISPFHHHTFGLWMVGNGARVRRVDHPFVARSLRLVEAVELAIDPPQQRGQAAAGPPRGPGPGPAVGGGPAPPRR